MLKTKSFQKLPFLPSLFLTLLFSPVTLGISAEITSEPSYRDNYDEVVFNNNNLPSIFANVESSANVIMWSCDWTTLGNLVTGLNTSLVPSYFPLDSKIISISHDGIYKEFGQNQPLIVIDGDHGTLNIRTDGNFSYESSEGSPSPEHREIFEIVLFSETAGSEQKLTFVIDVLKANRTANPLADYNNQIAGTNSYFQGYSAYQTSLAAGAIIFGWTPDDTLVGSNQNDAILAWAGNDTLVGNAGDDFLYGEQGSNNLFGGTGADAFIMHSDPAGSNDIFDTINDFSPAEKDVLVIQNIVSADLRSQSPNSFLLLENFMSDDGRMGSMLWVRQSSGAYFNATFFVWNSDFTSEMANIATLVEMGAIIF